MVLFIGDLKPDNVLITEDMKPILCDFTLSKLFDGIAGEGTHTGKISTVTYRAPEVVNREPYSFSVGDVVNGYNLLRVVSW